jgi:hypothetical protein
MKISAILVASLERARTPAAGFRGVSAHIVRNHDRKLRHGNLE